MRFYLGPGNNSLSHILKCLSIKEVLDRQRHQVFIAATARHSGFLKQLNQPHFVVPDLGDCDHSGFPSFRWFSCKKSFKKCIRAQSDLLKQISPDRVLGVFNFTLKISASLVRVPYDSLVCGCMLKESEDILGFHGDEPGALDQKINMETFFSFATKKIQQHLGHQTDFYLEDARDLLKGEKTYLWDFPQFMPMAAMQDIQYVGPVTRVSRPVENKKTRKANNPLAVISFGTCSGDGQTLKRLAEICLEAGLDVFIAAGGQQQIYKLFEGHPRISASLFADLGEALSKASVFICHGGQMSVFESLKARVPVLVMPFQPEQAHNGICLERIGCGSLLVPPKPFRAGPSVYTSALNDMRNSQIKKEITHLCEDPAVEKNLIRVNRSLDACKGAKAVAQGLVRS